jgi:hypothetical protein
MKITRSLLQSLTFRPFTKNDYYGFSGVESPVPMIAEDETQGICVIIDGDTVELYEFDVDGSFDCVDVCDSIRALPTQTQVEKRIARLKAELAQLEA